MISFDDFQKIDVRLGTVIAVDDFPEARKPAYQLQIDFGPMGIKKSSAQITNLYSKEDLINRQVLAVVNFPKKQIATFMSECLVLGIETENGVVLLGTDKQGPNGAKVS